MTRNSHGQVGQDIKPLKIADSRNGQQAGRGQFAIGAPVAETDFTPLDASAERSFGAVVGRLHTFVFQKSVQPVVVLEQGRC